MRYLLVLLLPLVAFGQGFGNFRTDQPFLAASASTPSIIPTDLSNLKFWFKADAGTYLDAGTTPCTNSGLVYQWNDQSGNGSHLTQTASADRPKWYTNEINGKPSVYLSNKMLDGAVSWGPPATVLFVAKFVTGSTYYWVISSTATGAGEAQFLGTVGDDLSFFAGGASSQGVVIPFVPRDTWMEIAVWGTNITAGIYGAHARTNGVFASTSPLNYGWGFTGTALRIGRSKLNSQGSTFYLAELIVYSDYKSTNDVIAVETYLKNKYGL